MAENRQIAEVFANPTDVRQPLTQVRLPYTFLGRLWSKQDHSLAFVQNETLNQHQAHEGLAQTNAVAQECPAILPGNLHQSPVGLLLIAIDLWKHSGAGL